jgi:hypothetical protein
MDRAPFGPIRRLSIATPSCQAHDTESVWETPMRLILAAILLGAVPAMATPIGPPAPVASRTTAAQQAIALYRDEYRHGYISCPAPTRANEVVICGNGRGGSANRLPLPDERAPPDWARQRTGEPGTGAQALVANQPSCMAANCPAHGAIDMIAAGTGLVQVVRAIVDPEGASDYADRHPWKPKD